MTPQLVTALLLVASVAQANPQAAAPRESSAQIVKKVQDAYDRAKDVHAKFEQTLHSQIGGDKKASGEVWLKKPGKMRWDYATPEKKLMVSDGKSLWVYEPEDAQAFKQDLKSSTLPTSVSFLVGEGKLADEFEVTIDKTPGVGTGDEVVLKLVPKVATAAYRYLLFVVDPRTGLVQKSILYDQQGGTNQLDFSGVETNVKGSVGDSKFKFTPPAGTKVINAPH
jgi:outer membrane lipoprotein carrier protein